MPDEPEQQTVTDEATTPSGNGGAPETEESAQDTIKQELREVRALVPA